MPAMEVEPDARIGAEFAGRYRIIRPLGQGDRKRTYLAEDTVLTVTAEWPWRWSSQRQHMMIPTGHGVRSRSSPKPGITATS